MSAEMDAHGYIEEATAQLFEGVGKGSSERASANALIAIAMSLEEVTDHLAYLSTALTVTLADPLRDPVQEVTRHDYDNDWRAEWQKNIDLGRAADGPAVFHDVVLPPRDTDNIHPYRDR